MLHLIRDSDAWSMRGALAKLRAGVLAAQVDVAQPQAGIHALQLDRKALDGQLLHLTQGGTTGWPAAVGDTYVRGRDLVTSYKPGSDWPYAPQVYWSAGAAMAAGNVLAEVSLLVSIQTDLLDTHPQVDAGSQLTAEAMLRIFPTGGDDVHVERLPDGEHTIEPAAPACVLWRLAACQMSYVEFVLASDFHRLTIRCRSGATCETAWQLFAEFLEKGVIRRARIHAAFLPRENDVQLSANWCRAVEHQPLPLTT